MIIGFVGLGLIGGSLAKAVRGFQNAEIYGFDTDQKTILKATGEGVIDQGFTDLRSVRECDFVILSLPLHIEQQIFDSCTFKKNAVVIDVCGVKTIMDSVPVGLDYLSTHPMAGKEVGGYENSEKDLFSGANFILTPRETTSQYAVALTKKLANFIGCKNIFTANREHHDSMIAFTSQLPHALAACIVNTEYYADCHGFEGGSLADFTRIARMDSKMWADLFLQNKEQLLSVFHTVRQNMDVIQNCLEEDEGKQLESFLAKASKNREEHE